MGIEANSVGLEMLVGLTAVPNIPMSSLHSLTSPYGVEQRTLVVVTSIFAGVQPLVCSMMCHFSTVYCRSVRVEDDSWVHLPVS